MTIDKNVITELDYVSTPIPEDGVFKISPSSFSKFVERPHAWYRQEVLKEDVFEYNTSSVIGTIVHYCAEKVAKQEEVDLDEIERYISKHGENDDYSARVVRAQFQNMAERLVNDYVLNREFLEVESQVRTEIKDNFWAAGTLDILEGTNDDCLLGDYKTYSSKTKPRTIPQHYKYQLLTYAYILKQSGYNVTRIRLIYINRHIEGEISEKTNKRMKSYPPEVTILTEVITQEDIDFIEGLLLLCVDSCLASDNYPELNHVIWHDPRLAV
jgi:CRISPR/Cas system-associated exonuclease Cas4 (RecB family)